MIGSHRSLNQGEWSKAYLREMRRSGRDPRCKNGVGLKAVLEEKPGKSKVGKLTDVVGGLPRASYVSHI